MLNFCDFIQVFVFTTNHHVMVTRGTFRESNFTIPIFLLEGCQLERKESAPLNESKFFPITVDHSLETLRRSLKQAGSQNDCTPVQKWWGKT